MESLFKKVTGFTNANVLDRSQMRKVVAGNANDPADCGPAEPGVIRVRVTCGSLSFCTIGYEDANSLSSELCVEGPIYYTVV